MVLIAAAVCTKTGKAIISRQFVEMTKSRIEGLLAAFPKLMSGGKQHTFVETDSVRYVYQPLDKLYMLLITTKTSNILEDLETLRLFSRVIPEYCRTMDDSEILDNAFNLIFAFDEIVALGYRESVNLAQIRTFVEMDSHEEKVYQAVRQTQEREAKLKMREEAKKIQRLKIEAQKRGGPRAGGMGGGMGGGYGSSHGGFNPSPSIGESIPAEPPKPLYSAPSRKPASSKAMKLGGKSKDVDSFVDQLKSEGEKVMSDTTVRQPVQNKVPTQPAINTESVHAKLEEKITVTARRDGALENMEVLGMLTLRISDEQFGRIRLHIENASAKGVQMQTHPNIDKELMKKRSQIGLKNPDKPFPLNTDVGVLKWRLQTSDDEFLPLTINCWPAENGQGGCDVNIEYELLNENLELNDVTITIPFSHGSSPVVSECDGEYTVEKRGLIWQLPVIDQSNTSGSMEFSAAGNPDDFFPVQVSFYSKKSYAGLKVLECSDVASGAPVKHSTETAFIAERYEFV